MNMSEKSNAMSIQYESDSKDREEEIDALAAIYSTEFNLIGPNRFELSLTVVSHLSKICLRCHLPEKYPSAERPLFELEAEWLDHVAESAVSAQLNVIWKENVGNVIIFLWSNWIQFEAAEFLTQRGLHLFNCGTTGDEQILVNSEGAPTDDSQNSDTELDQFEPSDEHESVQTNDDVVCLLKLDHMRQVLSSSTCGTVGAERMA